MKVAFAKKVFLFNFFFNAKEAMHGNGNNL